MHGQSRKNKKMSKGSTHHSAYHDDKRSTGNMRNHDQKGIMYYANPNNFAKIWRERRDEYKR